MGKEVLKQKIIGVEMEEIIIDDNLKLIPYYPNQQTTLEWYQDLDVCKQADNIDTAYTKERLNSMYNLSLIHI